MSVSSEISRISSAVAECFSAVTAMGGNYTQAKLANLAAAIRTIPVYIPPAQLVLYDAGQEHSSTGGWYSSNGEKFGTYVECRITGTSEGRIYPANKIDVTEYSTLYAEIENVSSSLSCSMKLGLRSSTNAYAASVAGTTETIQKTVKTTLSVDISSVSGSYYPIAASETVSVRWRLHKLWLE